MAGSLGFVVLDIETLHAVDWKAVRAPGGFRPWSDMCWDTVWPAQVCAVRFDDGEETDRLSTTIDWGVYGVPETFLVGKDGKIAAKHVGPLTVDAVKEQLLPEIEKALAAGSAPATGS